MSITVKIVTKSGKVPAYATAGSAGMDLQAFIEEDIVLEPGQRALIGTGLYMELPAGYEAQIRPRSGLAIKHGISLVNAVGTIDADYRGEIGVPLINLGQDSFTIKSGDRIAQMVIKAYEQAELFSVETLTDTERGAGGFGHTGI